MRAGYDSEKEDLWYAKNVIGSNTLTETYHNLGAILENDELKAVTAHGGRALFVTESLLHGVTAAAIVAQAGYANEGSMRHYA